ncbi:MAG: alpha/beta fold hydrolase [Pirellulaceae bacterium]|nr:alpha/beta fold hydrolase [Pirellulaceae bacterium]
MSRKTLMIRVRTRWLLPRCITLGLGLCFASGCVSLDNPTSVQRLAMVASIGTSETVKLKRVHPTPLEQVKRYLNPMPPEPSARNQQILRRYALQKQFQSDRTAAIDKLWELSEVDANADLVACVSLLSLAEAQHHARYSRSQAALDWHILSLVSACNYLWSPKYEMTRNQYDPNFSDVTTAYNESLKELLRFLKKNSEFREETSQIIATRLFDLKLDCRILGQWDEQEFERLEFVSDFDIQGLKNHHRQYGLGVPLIAVRAKREEMRSPSEKYYPPNLTFPVTAFLRLPTETQIFHTRRPQIQAELEMIDPLRQTKVFVNNLESPLATDFTAPLAYYLNDPLYRSNLLAHVSLLNSELGDEVRGLYMLEPYDPAKIPVVMVHGFWSSAITWTEMFNDLRANPVINQRYQFWFYMYPTGQPFWVSAKQMRDDLAEVHQTLDPESKSLALDQMVLVGHSMGGLISYLQTVDSGDKIWKLLSDEPFENVKGDPAVIDDLRKTFFFTPNPQVKRVVTMAMPYQGSDIANPTTRWLGRSFFRLPQLLLKGNSELVKQNPGLFKNADLLTIDTSVDSLALDSPFFVALNQVRPAPWTRYHNVYGRYQPTNAYQRWEQYVWGEGDGVVDVENAQFPYANSTDEVDGRHMTLHHSAKSIWIVRQVLLQHLADSAPPTRHDARSGPPIMLADASTEPPQVRKSDLLPNLSPNTASGASSTFAAPAERIGSQDSSTVRVASHDESASDPPKPEKVPRKSVGRFLPAIPETAGLR